MPPNLGEEDTIERIIKDPKSVSWETFKEFGIDPVSLIPPRRDYDWSVHSKLPVHSYTGVSSLWRTRKTFVPAKYKSFCSNVSSTDRENLYSSSVRNTDQGDKWQANTSADDELIVYDTEVIYVNCTPDNVESETNVRSDNETFYQSPESDSHLDDSVDNAYELLASFKLNDAETMFLNVFKDLDETSEEGKQSTVKVMMGLAEICLRKSRMTRGNPMESQWLQAHNIALLQYAVQLCSEALQSEGNNQMITWYQEQHNCALKKMKPAEENFVKSMYTYIQSDKASLQRQMFFSLSAPTTPTGEFNFPLSSTPLQHVFPGVQFQRNASVEHLSSENNAFPGGLQWMVKFQEYCQDRLRSKDSARIVEQLFSLNSEISDLLNKDPEDCDKDKATAQSETKPDEGCNDITQELDVPSEQQSDEGCKDNVQESGIRDEAVELQTVSPLHACTVSLTLAKLISKLAEKLVGEGECVKGEALYEQSREILEFIQDGTKGMVVLYAQTVKKLGMLKIKLGDISSGIQLLQTAIRSYREVGDEASNGDIALALVEIGDSHTIEKWDSESIFDHVIDVIREAFDKESLADVPLTSKSNNDPEESKCNSPSKEMSQSYCSSTQEAIWCYEEAIDILENLPLCDVLNSTVYARAITRLGDSHFIQQEYNEALFCYEKAQTLFRVTSGRSALIQHGHVLCMLGTTSFMLHLYPKAAMVFECAYRMLKHAFRGEYPYKMALLLSLLGLATYKLQHYHKCISWSFRAYEMYIDLFKDSLTNLPRQKLWIACQTLYILGNSYNVLNLHEKAIHYLTLGRSIMTVASNTDRRQYMRVLQVLGDCYFAQYDYKTALTFYNEALQDFEGEALQLIRVHQNIAELNQSSDDKGFHNQLLSRSADAHLHMQEYKDAFGLLAQVSNIQDVLEDDIKGDLVTTLHQLGNMHSMSGDADQAIQSFKDCVEIYQEVHGDLGPEMSIILGNLATMCYVKACTSEGAEEELEMTIAAEQNFQDAIALENNLNVLVKYSSFLFSQGNYDDAVMYLQDALKQAHEEQLIGYSGLEKVTLPEVLQDEVDYQSEVSFPATPLIHYLLMVSHKALGEMKVAEDHLLLLMKEVMKGDNPVMHSLVGYALMDMGMFKDAAEFFAIAFHMKEDYHLATDNYCTCLGIMVLHTLQKSVENIYFSRNKEQ
ncbi:uncharacterized protein LOC135472640 [Liolophura sinensis]|uniref:uncharacterized protein LOC135472640 n=1 Tax=Liolophura sinensis TaxID=3198878 RepID=UPI0031595509